LASGAGVPPHGQAAPLRGSEARTRRPLRPALLLDPPYVTVVPISRNPVKGGSPGSAAAADRAAGALPARPGHGVPIRAGPGWRRADAVSGFEDSWAATRLADAAAAACRPHPPSGHRAGSPPLGCRRRPDRPGAFGGDGGAPPGRVTTRQRPARPRG